MKRIETLSICELESYANVCEIEIKETFRDISINQGSPLKNREVREKYDKLLNIWQDLRDEISKRLLVINEEIPTETV